MTRVPHGGAILAIKHGRLEEATGRRNRGAKTGKAELCGPASLCDFGLTPVRDDQSYRETFRSLWSRARPHGFPCSRAATDRGPCFASRLQRRGFRLGRLEADRRWDMPREAPCRLCLTVLRQSRQTVMLPLACPAAFGRPWQWTTSGLPCPCETSACFPEPSDFSGGAFHNRASHILRIHEATSLARRRRRLSPISTGVPKGNSAAHKFGCEAASPFHDAKDRYARGVREGPRKPLRRRIRHA